MKGLIVLIGLFFSATAMYAQHTTSDKDAMRIADVLLSKMTLSEKVLLLHGDHIYSFPGIKRLGIPPFYPSDGPCAVRPELTDDGRYVYGGDSTDCTTAFPTLSALSATWNPELANQFGRAISSEQRARGKDMYLGPGVNIMRTPLDGRSFEYMGEDPCLTSNMAVAIIRGVQQNNESACIKHFALNNQEEDRFNVNVTVGERALHEIYLAAFEAAVKKGGVLGVMAAYNKFNGDWCSENDYLLNKVLKQTWGFKGVVISDWGAIHSMMKAVNAGCDLESSTTHNYVQIEKAVNEGRIPVSLVNEKVRRLLFMYAKIGKIGADSIHRTKGELLTEEHKLLAREIAEQSIVLLKNREHILPLNKHKISKLVIVGKVANARLTIGINTKGSCDLLLGGGSGEAKPLYEITPLEGIRHYLPASVKVEYIDSNYNGNDFVRKVKNADAVLVFTGDTHVEEREGADRKDIALPEGQDEMVRAVLAIQPNTIVVNQSGAPVAMPWVDEAKVIVQNWFNGQETGNALAQVIFGDVNPSGRLNCTFPKRLSDVACHYLDAYKPVNEHYKEGLLVGYRWFEEKNIKPMFAFGFGLSYTKFDFKNIQAPAIAKKNQRIPVKVTLTNSGFVKGAEVVQLYLHAPSGKIFNPKQGLKTFDKIVLQPKASKTVTLFLEPRDFCYWDETIHDWKRLAGKYEIRVGAASNDIRLRKWIEVK